MAGFFHNSFRNIVWGSGTRVDLDADTIRSGFVDAADDVPGVADDFIDDIASAARVPASLTNWVSHASKTVGVVGVGVYDAADLVFTSLTGDQSEWLTTFKDTGVEATSDLIRSDDTATGLPLTPNGANVTVTWAAGGIYTA